MNLRERGKVRWGILGCGDVAEIKSGPGFQKAVGSELVAVMRRQGELAADFARRHGVGRWYDNADALIQDPEVDAVYIAAPPGSHLELALKVCRAGKPAYVEKPMARNFVECEQLVRAFGETGVPLFVAYYRRCLPRFLKAKELLNSGRLGTISGVTYRQSTKALTPGGKPLPWRLKAEHSGGGLFLDVGSHTLDLLDYLFGPLEDISGTAGNVGSRHAVEDSVAMKFRLAGGALGVASWNFASAVGEDLLEITGTAGRMSISVFGNDAIVVRGVDGVEERFDALNPPHVHQPLIQTVVDELLGWGECPSTGTSGSRTSRVMDLVLESYYGGRGDAFWNREASWAGRQSGNPV